ncbi:MAG: proline--tRNA ligase [Parachlamydiales bacterium]|nr:proline--tRNA ligase [Parachlamydiales bacterium]
MKKKHAITPTREEDFPLWYQEVVKEADLAEHSPVRGCMVIKPWGYGIWENIHRILDQKIKESGHSNVYFPLFIPVSYFEKEAQHIAGFAKECAVVTHHRLESKEGKLIPAAPLEEPLIVRPTSEMIVGDSFSRWVESYRDLPLKINQWANIVRWEMRTRPFLRTTEFLWQEGHTVHASEKEAQEHALFILELYKNFCRDDLAMPVLVGKKTEGEKFPGAVTTYALEAMMGDKKALQAGTSHFLGQNFAKACNIRFTDEKGSLEYGWTTSWGVTTRLIGALVMMHGDDDGLVLPPKIAPKHLVIMPIIRNLEDQKNILQFCHTLKDLVKEEKFQGRNIEIVIDDRDKRGGEKKWQWIKKGIPLWLEIGQRELDEKKGQLFRRDLLGEKGTFIDLFAIKEEMIKALNDMQKKLLHHAEKFLHDNICSIENRDDFYRFFQSEKTSGFAKGFYVEDPVTEEMIKNDLNVTVRSIPLEQNSQEGRCIFSKRPSKMQAIFAKAY